ncbi:MAG: peptidoglycan-binding domain-containing protein, partial [Woeseiaceae bacterium]|nr:peptidoglycan-binding domain-containing protein [Woeseiaceae bacterium]
MQLERWEGVNCFAKTETVMGQKVTTYFVKTEVEASNGEIQTVFLQSTSCALDTGQGSDGRMTPEQMEAYAEGLEMTGSALSEGVGDGLENAGMPRDLLKSMGGDPWVSPDPGTMMGGMGEFMRGSAEGQREMARERKADAEESADGLVAFRDRATLVGNETVDGRKAWHLRVEDLDQVEKLENGQELALNTVSVWIDSADYVTLKTRIDGIMTEGGEQRPVVMEQSSADFRTVPGSDMYEPYRQTVTMSGMLSEADKAQMAEAEEQLAEAERQMASMPPDQRAMVEQMMGGQMDMLRSMVDGGGFTMETVVDEIVVNPEPGAMANGAVMPTLAAPASPPGGDEVLKRVQENLAALGYDTGNTDGIESTETTIAISQFQAENGMEVTGKPSPQLAGILAAKVSGAGG